MRLILLSKKGEFKLRPSMKEAIRGAALKKARPTGKYLLVRSNFINLYIYSVEPSTWWRKLIRANDVTDTCMCGSQEEAERYFKDMGYRIDEVRCIGGGY